MEQPLLYLQMFIAQYQLQMGYEQACKDALEVGKAALDNMTDVRSQKLAGVARSGFQMFDA